MPINEKILKKAPRNKLSPRVMLEEITSGSVDAILASLFRNIFNSLGIGDNPTVGEDNKMSTSRWNQLIDSYLRDPVNAVKQNRVDLSSGRGNLTKEIFKEVMTFRTFCKCLRFAKIFRFDICIRAYHKNGMVTEHIKKVDLGSYNADESEEEET